LVLVKLQFMFFKNLATPAAHICERCSQSAKNARLLNYIHVTAVKCGRRLVAFG
jgi:hypothetical protein